MQHVHGSYDMMLVLFSYVVAVAASYTVLDLAGRISTSKGLSRWLWLLFGAVAMALGVWSMHFIGMLALSLNVKVAYNLETVILSILVVIPASFFALFIVGRSRLSLLQLLGGGVLLAAGISAMHYIGMAAMQIDITYKPVYFVLSIIIALVASIAALWLSFYFRKGNEPSKVWKKLGSGLIMGAAIVGMHFTGMQAAQFQVMEHAMSLPKGMVLDQKLLAYLIAVSTFLTLGLSLGGIYVSNRFSRKESEIEQSEKWYKSLFENNQDGIISIDMERRIIGFNSAITKLTGLPGEWFLNQKIIHILPLIVEEEQERTKEPLAKSFGGELQNYQTALIHQDGHRVELSVVNVPVVLDGQVVGTYIIAKDVTEENYSKQKIEYLAFHDELTGMPNRRMFNQVLSQMIDEHTGPFPVMVLDIDRFKMINDSLGHTYGDLFLQEMSSRILDCIHDRKVTLARMGGDEFTLLCDSSYGREEAARLAEQIIGAIATPYRLKENDFYVTASIGIAVYPFDGEDTVQLLKNADTAMYEVKKNGKQFHQLHLTEHIGKILEETGLDPKYLELEITESMMMDAAASSSLLNELTETGIRVSLDDFGTGYSSLSYLKHLPIHKLKIDRSFIRDITDNRNDQAIVATIISMAQHLNMDVIAEGIETKEQLDILMNNNCEKIQGYYYSRPLPAEEVEEAFFEPMRNLPISS